MYISTSFSRVSFSAAISENCLYASKRARSKLRLVISDDSAWSRSCLYASFFSRSRRSFHLTILSFSVRNFSQSSSSRITFSSCRNSSSSFSCSSRSRVTSCFSSSWCVSIRLSRSACKTKQKNAVHVKIYRILS